MEIQQSMGSNFLNTTLLLYLSLQIMMTFSTPTGDYTQNPVNECNDDLSPVATCINENTGMTGLPNLHDGFFDGLWLSANKGVHLFVRTLAGERSTIVLTDVEALNINGLRAGNIILELVLIGPDKLTMEDMTQVYDLKPDEAEKARKLLSKAQERSLSALEMNTSYGAEGKVLFRAIDAIPEHVLA